jgi:hypothetical protein
MKFEDNQTYWVLLAATKFSGVPTYARDTGIPTAGRTTSINDAKRFASRDEAIEWGNHLNFGVFVRRVTETRTYVMTEEK